MANSRLLLSTLSAVLLSAFSLSQAMAQGATFSERFSHLGSLTLRDSRDIQANPWSVGAEGIDRNMSTPSSWLAVLGELGVKRVRLQSGWAKSDDGFDFEFQWLDDVVDQALEQGVEPWISLSYGNPLIEGGATAASDSPLPTGYGRERWVEYVQAVVSHFNGRVRTWEIWNEPEISGSIAGKDYGRFVFETSTAIRSAQLNAEIFAGAFSNTVLREDSRNRGFARDALIELYSLGPSIIDGLTYHGYASVPETIYDSLEQFESMVKTFDAGLVLRQGEAGAPSQNQPRFAMPNQFWTEEAQAKWVLRRMIGDAARGIDSSIFTLVDLHYPVEADGRSGLNSKGLLSTHVYAPGLPEDDQSVRRQKAAFQAVQHVTSIFDSSITPIPASCTTGADGVAIHQFVSERGGQILAIWRMSDRPGEAGQIEEIEVRCEGELATDDLVYIDLLTGAVYGVKGFGGTVPISDYPVLLASDGLVSFH